MPKANRRESGQTFLTTAMSLIPEAQRVGVQAALDAALADDTTRNAFFDQIGEGALRQDEFSRAMDEARQEKQRAETWHRNLQTWHSNAQGQLSTLESLRQDRPDLFNEDGSLKRGRAADPDPDPDDRPAPRRPAAPTVTGLSADEFNTKLAQRDAEWAGFFAEVSPLSFEHYARYKEPLAVDRVLAHARQNGQSFRDAYQVVYADQIRQHQTSEAQAREQQIRAEIEKKVRSEFASRPPHPTGTSGLESSPIDWMDPGVKDPASPEQFSAHAAAAEYMERYAARSSGGNPPSA